MKVEKNIEEAVVAMTKQMEVANQILGSMMQEMQKLTIFYRIFLWDLYQQPRYILRALKKRLNFLSTLNLVQPNTTNITVTEHFCNVMHLCIVTFFITAQVSQ